MSRECISCIATAEERHQGARYTTEDLKGKIRVEIDHQTTHKQEGGAELDERASPVRDVLVFGLLLALGLAVSALQGFLRALAWLPSLIYHCGIHKTAFDVWLFQGWW